MSESPQDRWSPLDDAGLLAVVTAKTRAESAQAAERMDAIAALGDRYDIENDDSDQRFWAVDTYEQVVAEVAAAAGMTQKAAARLVSTAVALRRRLPKLAALFRRGEITAQLASAITWRTDNVSDDAILLVDTALADAVTDWGPMSKDRTEASIDFWVNHFDPEAVRETRKRARGRGINMGAPDDVAGVTAIWGALLSADAAVLQKRLTQMAKQVCDDDPRTLRQRCADALGALGAGQDRLRCECGSPTCAAADTPAADNVFIHILADPAALEAPADPDMSGVAEDDSEWLHDPAGSVPAATEKLPHSSAEARTPQQPDQPGDIDEGVSEQPVQHQPDAPAFRPEPPAFILGRGFIPASHVADLIRKGATVRPLKPNSALLIPEKNYRPSRALADAVRMRDLTCRFPHCDVPADRCDLDHTTPWPQGLTHPSNLKCLCRFHHLIKTFCGWTDQQLPDGTVIWTSPAGQRYTTLPGSRLLFPHRALDTGPLPAASPKPKGANAGFNMPLRKRTRAQARAQRIATERAHRQREIAENGPPF